MTEEVILTRSDIDTMLEVDLETGKVFVVSRLGVLTAADGSVMSKGVKHRRPIDPEPDDEVWAKRIKGEPADIKATAEQYRTPKRLARYAALTAEEAATLPLQGPLRDRSTR
ncbi:MAG: hypothetical protein DRH30_00520 [Deltaproteobacteria bacterium]|nr:MAG: hypothetical protein DRH30_00520 [Deltaproteobacteria bacterium]